MCVCRIGGGATGDILYLGTLTLERISNKAWLHRLHHGGSCYRHLTPAQQNIGVLIVGHSKGYAAAAAAATATETTTTTTTHTAVKRNKYANVGKALWSLIETVGRH